MSIALNEPAHRQQALTALEDFAASNHRARSDAVMSARTALCSFDPKRAARAFRTLEGTAAAFLATSVVAGSYFGSNGVTRVLITVAVWIVLLAAVTAFSRLRQPYLGA